MTRERIDRMIALINEYNEASSPSVPRTDAEHADCATRARIALNDLRTGYTRGVHYREFSNGMMWPMRGVLIPD